MTFIDCHFMDFQEVNFMMLDAGQGLLSAVESVIEKVFLPSLNRLEKGWGVLDEAKNAQAKTDFISSLNSFATVLASKEVLASTALEQNLLAAQQCRSYTMDVRNVDPMNKNM